MGKGKILVDYLLVQEKIFSKGNARNFQKLK